MYAYPEKRKYPLNTRQQVHAAIAHFAANRRSYPPAVAAKIAARIRRAAKERGIRIHSRKLEG